MHIDTADAQAQSKLAAIRAGKAYHEQGVVEVNGNKCAFLWQVLTRGEKQECLSRAITRFAELGIPPELRAYSDLQDELLCQVLAVAMRDPEDTAKTIAKDADEVRGLLSVAAIDALWNQYGDFEDRVNPDLDASPYIEAIESAIKKKDKRVLMSFGTDLLASYLLLTDEQQSS